MDKVAIKKTHFKIFISIIVNGKKYRRESCSKSLSINGKNGQKCHREILLKSCSHTSQNGKMSSRNLLLSYIVKWPECLPDTCSKLVVFQQIHIRNLLQVPNPTTVSAHFKSQIKQLEHFRLNLIHLIVQCTTSAITMTKRVFLYRQKTVQPPYS